ncbi:MAG: hypothetical protein KF867_08145 [Cryobacterium sp.]|nr:hypothetical protein [Cryobacterium sp.]MBX3104933.1 hypothetical protein [Cryobacterium sp.]
MSGTIYEFFGYRSSDRSEIAVRAAHEKRCPFINDICQKRLSDGTISGVCTVKPVTSKPVICCPIRLYADEYKILKDIAECSFAYGIPIFAGGVAVAEARLRGAPVVAVFGKRWGGELRLPQKDGVGNYYVDWVLALLDSEGVLKEFVAVEVQTIDTTGNYRASRDGLLSKSRDVIQSTVGLNWENVNKRIIPQLVYKGQVLQREEKCRKGLFFVCPTPVYEKIVARLGGEENLVKYALQPASITFLAYDLWEQTVTGEGEPLDVELDKTRSTTVYKVQEAFNNVTLPSENIYETAIKVALDFKPI